MAYVGTTPIPKASLTLTQGTLASSSQTITVPGGYTPGNIFVYINGYRLQTSEYTASDGSIIDLGEVFPAGTDYVVEEVRSFTLPDAYTKAEIQNASFDFVNMPTVGGDPVVESGSNSDGEWTRWADGTQICTSNDKTFTEGDGQRRLDCPNWTFPVAFNLVPTVNYSNLPSVVGAGTGTWDNENTSQKKVSFAGLNASATSASALRIWSTALFSLGEYVNDIRLTANGRWK